MWAVVGVEGKIYVSWKGYIFLIREKDMSERGERDEKRKNLKSSKLWVESGGAGGLAEYSDNG